MEASSKRFFENYINYSLLFSLSLSLGEEKIMVYTWYVYFDLQAS